jgi:hypothetical protein
MENNDPIQNPATHEPISQELWLFDEHKAVAVVSFADNFTDPVPNQTVDNPKRDNFSDFGYGDVAAWGTDNNLPQRIYKEANNNGLVAPILNRKAELILSKDWEIGKEVKDGKEKVFEPEIVPEIEDYLEEVNVDEYFYQATYDHLWLNHIFPVVVPNKEGTKISNLSIQKAANCRFAKQNKQGVINKVYVNANWDIAHSEQNSYTMTYPLISRTYDPVGDLQQKVRGKQRQFMYPAYMPDLVNTYYNDLAWHCLFQSETLDWAKSIPKYKKALMQNQFSAEMVIEIDARYWKATFPDWDKETHLKQSRKDKVKEEINDMLTGAKNAGKPIYSPMLYDEKTQQQISLIKFTPIKKNENSGTYIEDSQEVSSLILFALNMPAPLMGTAPSKGGLGGGSGSDVREYFNLFHYTTLTQEKIILEVLNKVVFPFNGWKDYKIRFKKPILQTLDKVNPDQRQSTPTQ